MNSDQASPTSELLETILQDEIKDYGRGQIRRCLITGFRSTGEIVVADQAQPEALFTCDVLRTGESMPAYEIDMPVLMFCTSVERRLGIVLGRIGKYDRGNRSSGAEAKDHVVLEANETLRLKCGDSSVDLRKDGKVMIRGKDVLTRAKRTNRIKGGSVGIN